MPKKNKPTPWTLRPGDEIIPAALEAHPELAGMADHAVFRMLLFQQRIGMPPAWRQIVFFAVVLGFVLAMNVLPRLLRTNIPVMILCIVLLTFAYIVTLIGITNPGLVAKLSGRTHTVPVLSSLTAQSVADLTMAGLGPRDFLLALWASFLRRDSQRNLFRVRVVLLGITLLLLLLIVLFPAVRQAFIWIFIYLAFFAGQMFVMGRDPVPVAFNFAIQAIRHRRRRIFRARADFSRRTLVYILLVSLLPGMTFAVLMITKFSLPVMIFMMLVCLIAGTLAGRMLIGDFRRRFQNNHDRALQDLEIILDRVRGDFDKHPAQVQS